jgi:hypothetical protein
MVLSVPTLMGMDGLVLERRVDLGGELIPCQLARAPLVIERRLQRAHVELEQAAHFVG